MQFTLFWNSGDSEVISGADFETAVAKAGYGDGAFRALNFWSNNDLTEEYTYNKETRTWDHSTLSEKCLKAVKDLYIRPMGAGISYPFVSERRVKETLKQNGGFYRSTDYFSTEFVPPSDDSNYVLPKYLIEDLYKDNQPEKFRILLAYSQMYADVNAGLHFLMKVTHFGDPRQLLREYHREDFFNYSYFKDGAIDWYLWQNRICGKFIPEYAEKFKKVLVKKREYKKK